MRCVSSCKGYLPSRGLLSTSPFPPSSLSPLQLRQSRRRERGGDVSLLSSNSYSTGADCMSESAWISGDPSMSSSTSAAMESNNITPYATSATFSYASTDSATTLTSSGGALSSAKDPVFNVEVGAPNGPGNPPYGRRDGGDGDGGGRSGWWPNVFAILLRGVRSRFQADPYFGHKLAVECGLDAAIIVGVNYNARRDRFFPELEFTLCQLAISLLSDFALVYLLAPSSIRSSVVAGGLRGRLATALPSHVLQRGAFTPLERLGTFILKAGQYGTIGFVMGCLGASTVHGLITLREKMDPDFVSPETVQSCYGTGKAWGRFMAMNSNVRYNLVTAAEDAMYRCGSGVGKLSSVAFRLINNWLGAAQWVAAAESLDLNVPWESTRLSA